MNKKYFSLKSMSMLATALLLSLLTSCEKDTEPTNFAPTVVTGNAEDIYRFGATLSGSILNPNGYYIKEGGVEYSEYENFTIKEQVPATLTDTETNFSIALSELESNKEYYFRTYAFSGYNTVYSKTEKFKTSNTSGPIFGTTTTSNATFTTFDVFAELIDDGGDSNPSLKGFIYKQVAESDNSEFTIGQPGVQYIATESAGYSATVKDLYTNTRYAVRPIGISSLGMGVGEIAYVYTQKTNNALISSCTLSDTIQNSIRVSANLLSQGTYAIEEYGFCYSSEVPEPTAENNLKSIAIVSGSTFSATLNNLASETKYWIRAYVKDNAGNYTYSNAVTYTVIQHTMLVVTTLDATDITITSTNLHGNMEASNEGIIKEQGFCWSTTKALPETTDSKQTVTPASGDYTATISTEYGKTYYYRAYAINTEGSTFYGDVKTFTTPDLTPLVLTVGDATNVTETSATVSGTITNEDNISITMQGFCWSSENAEPVVGDSNTSTVTTQGSSFENVLNNLKPGTQYYFRVFAINEIGIDYSEVKQFTTAISYAPTLSETVVSDITLTTAKASASVTNNGGAAISERGFCISTTNQAPTTADRKVTVATEMELFTTTIDQLTEGTTYYIRAYAVNKNGTSYGESATFTTVGITLPTVIANAASDITETSATLSGAVTDNGNGTITEWGFCWSTTNSQPTVDDDKMEVTATETSFTSAITGLTRNTKYYFRAYAINEKGVAYSEVKEFTTAYIVNPAILSAVTVTNISQTTLTATATLTDDGRGIISEMGFCYVAGTGTPTVNDTKLTVPEGGYKPAGTPSVEVSKTLADDNGRLYKVVTCIPKNYILDGSDLGATEVYYTTDGTVPTSESTRYTGPINCYEDMTIRFQAYDPFGMICEGATIIADVKIGHDSFQTTLSRDISSLTPGTSYTIRAYAVNENGTAYSEPITITTKKNDPSEDDAEFPGVN